VRQLLVALQFAVLIGLLLITGVIYRQNSFALREGLRFDQEQILVIQSSCKGALRQTIEALPGVRGAACSMTAPTLDNSTQTTASTPAGGQALLWYSSVDFGFFELYGLKPLAGRFFARAYSNDALRDEPRDAPEAIVLNETAVRKLGFPSAAGAVGQVFTCGHAISVAQMRWSKSHPCEVVGVAPDYAVGSIRKPIEPAAYYVFPDQFAVLSVKLSGQQLPETLAAIDSVWTATGDAAPIKRVFLNQRVQELYLDVSRQAQLLAMFSGIAVFIACLGLFGLAAFTAERRTREIGIRKAMGAETCDIVRMLVWQFTKPVLWANLVAWPVAAYVMHRWLEGFAYHIDLAPWLFAVATAVAIGIALLTVGVHSIRVARARPVLALRDE
jgi:putative ABC transport system permease protein